MPRRPPNKRPDLNGLLVVDKPIGMTSMDVCRVVRRRTGGAKVGHGGTLDPLATGVLVVCLGRATKAIPAIMDAEKVYEAAVDLAAFSTTDDMEGEATLVEPPAPLPTEAQARAACAAFVGTIEQTPPAHSAIKVDGQRAYKLARRGERVELASRPVLIHDIELLEYDWPALRIRVRCGKGTYIRSLARDLGVRLGTGGRLAALRRTRVGAFLIEDARLPDALPDNIEAHDLAPIPGAPPSE